MSLIDSNIEFRKLAEEFMEKLDKIAGNEHIQYIVLLYNGDEQATFGMTCRACAVEACGKFIVFNAGAKHDNGHDETNADGLLN